MTSPGRHGGMAVAVPPPVVPTVRPASGSPVGAGPGTGPGVVSAGASPRPRPEGKRRKVQCWACWGAQHLKNPS